MWKNDTKCKYMFMFPLENLAHKGLNLMAFYQQAYSVLHHLTLEELLSRADSHCISISIICPIDNNIKLPQHANRSFVGFPAPRTITIIRNTLRRCVRNISSYHCCNQAKLPQCFLYGAVSSAGGPGTTNYKRYQRFPIITLKSMY